MYQKIGKQHAFGAEETQPQQPIPHLGLKVLTLVMAVFAGGLFAGDALAERRHKR